MSGANMGPIRRITANLPAQLLAKAQELSGQGITETLVQGLELICRKEALEVARRLRGHVRLVVDGGRERGRSRR